MNINTIVDAMPKGYRWATAEEAEYSTSSDFHLSNYMVQVRVGGTDDEPQTDLAIMWDCMIEFGEDHDHDPEQCEYLISLMNEGMPDDRDYSGWYDYDAGLRWSDFV